jgi:hypothetical protein
VNSVQLLGSTEKVKYRQAWEGLIIEPAAQYPTAHAVVYKIELAR